MEREIRNIKGVDCVLVTVAGYGSKKGPVQVWMPQWLATDLANGVIGYGDDYSGPEPRVFGQD